jgi:hypothetical protein
MSVLECAACGGEEEGAVNSAGDDSQIIVSRHIGSARQSVSAVRIKAGLKRATAQMRE